MSASTFVIVSPTDYQNILAELRSPADLLPDTPFLEAELPDTPSLFPAHQQDCLGALGGPQPLPWSPETQPSSRDPHSPPRSPPRPRQLVLSVRLPDPAPPKVRKPHIALNDQLLLSDEEDGFHQDAEPRQPLLAACEFDTDVAASTSPPSLTSPSSVTPSPPERPQGQTCVLHGRQEAVGPIEREKDVKMEKVSGMVATETEANVEKWLKPDLIRNVDRKCEMIMKGGCEGAEADAWLPHGEESVEKEMLAVEMKEAGGGGAELGDVRHRSEDESGLKNKQMEAQTVPEFVGQTVGDSEENVCQGGEMDAAEDTGGLAGSQSHVWLTPEGHAEGRAWVDRHPEAGSSEEEEEGDEELPAGSLLEVVEKEGGAEEKEELGGTPRVRLEQKVHGLEQTEKEVLSLVGWHSDSSSVNVEPPTPGRSVSSDLLDRRER